jgi:predicted Zn-dependent protease
VEDNAGALSELARCRLATGRTEEALALWERAIAIEPHTASLHANRAAVLAGLGRLADALAAIENAVRRAPEDAGFWNAYAQIAARAGRPEAAREAEVMAERLGRRPVKKDAPRGMMGIGS